MLTAAESVILRIAIEERFVSESELNQSQIKTARNLKWREMLKESGKEPDGRKVYQATAAGKRAFEERL